MDIITVNKNTKNSVCLILIGLCLGFLTGLSVSPVIQTVLTSLLTVITTIVSICAGFTISEGKINFKGVSKVELNIVPLTLLIIGITFGAICGVLIRTHDLLGNSNPAVLKKEASILDTKKEPPTPIAKKELQHPVTKKERQHPNNALRDAAKEKKSELDENTQKQRAGVLYNFNQKTCDIVKSFSGKQLIFELQTLGDDNINALIDSCHRDPDIVKNRLIKICSKH